MHPSIFPFCNPIAAHKSEGLLFTSSWGGNESQVFGGKIKTYTFLPPSQSSLAGLEKASLLLWDRKKEDDIPPLLYPQGQGQNNMVPSISPLTKSLVQLKNINVSMCPVATCAVSMVNAMQQSESTEKEARMFRLPRAGKFLSQLLIAAPDFHAQHDSQSIYPSS